MAVRQYVGARYVPKFADPLEWQSGTSYEALTVVTYNNNSYTSKIPVPATVGNPANNTNYWALTGNFNSQVETYRRTTEEVENNLLFTNYPEVKVITDSYGDSNAGRGELLANIRDYANISADRYETAHLYGVGFSYAVQNTTFTTLLSQLTASSNYGVLLVIGGINDCYRNIAASTVTSAVINFITTARAKFPNYHIVWAPIEHICDTLTHITNWYGSNGLLDTIAQTFVENGCCSLTNGAYIYDSPDTDFSDYIHLSEDGAKLAARFIANYLTGKSTDTMRSKTLTITPTNGTFSFYTNPIQTISNGLLSVQNNNILSYRPTTPALVSSNTNYRANFMAIQIATISGGIRNSLSDYTKAQHTSAFGVVCLFQDSDTSVNVIAAGSVFIQNKGLYVSFQSYGSKTNLLPGFVPGDLNLAYIEIMTPMNIVVPWEYIQ